VAPRSENPKLIILVINFELVQPICPRYINVKDGRTDRRTDGQHTIVIPHYVHRAVKTEIKHCFSVVSVLFKFYFICAGGLREGKLYYVVIL